MVRPTVTRCHRGTRHTAAEPRCPCGRRPRAETPAWTASSQVPAHPRAVPRVEPWAADGTAFFDGVVTSGANNDAWLMHADLQDVNRKYLGNIIANQLNSDIGKFVMNLPDKSRQYPWQTRGTFDPGLYPRIKHMALHSHC